MCNLNILFTSLYICRTLILTTTALLTFKYAIIFWALDAQKFCQEDTNIEISFLMALNKKMEKKIYILQCKTCKKTDHRKGDSKCDGQPRCPRCWGTDHTAFRPTCKPVCWKHGEGHSSGSNRCPINVEYKRNQRKVIR